MSSRGQIVVTGVAPFRPLYVPPFNRAEGSAIPMLVDFHRILTW